MKEEWLESHKGGQTLSINVIIEPAVEKDQTLL